MIRSGIFSPYTTPAESIPIKSLLQPGQEISDMSYSTEYQLHQAEYILEQSIENTAIQSELVNYGYSKEKLLHGKKIVEEAIIALENEISHDSYQDIVSDKIREYYLRAQDRFQDHTKLARVAFKSDPIALKRLGLADRRKRAMTGLIEQMYQFYSNILEDDYSVGKLSEYGVSQEVLQESAEMVEKLFHHTRSEDIAEIRQVIERCDKALDRLEDWLSDFLVVAEVAFKKRPQLLKQIGLHLPDSNRR